MNDTEIRNAIVFTLRETAESVTKTGLSVRMPVCGPDDDPFVDKACKMIERGGDLDGHCLGSLLQYIADMMEN